MKGQTLIELLVTMSIAIIILVAASTVILSSLNNAQNSKVKNLATEYAQEGMETIRQMRNMNYNTFKNYNGKYCLAKGENILRSSCTNPNVDTFIRSVEIEQNSNCNTNAVQVTLSVSWADKKCSSSDSYCQRVSLITCLSTDNPIPAP
jgi:type II secretory pathway pseudopilin PulG